MSSACVACERAFSFVAGATAAGLHIYYGLAQFLYQIFHLYYQNLQIDVNEKSFESVVYKLFSKIISYNKYHTKTFQSHEHLKLGSGTA